MMALESLVKEHFLRLYLFNTRSPAQLFSNDTFLLRKSLAGKMMMKPDTTIYYATSPTGFVSKIALYSQDSLMMFVYDEHDCVIDSMPLRTERYASLLKSKEDVFLLYRGWLEMKSQQIKEALDQVANLRYRQNISLYRQTYWVKNRRELLLAEERLRSEQRDVEHKINVLTLPNEEVVGYMLRNAYPGGTAEISYLPGLGFVYTVSSKRGEKLYELSDHRGNVMAAVSDRKTGVDNGNTEIAYYNVDVVNANDYYPFGALIPERTYNNVNDKYRYGFNGKENDNDVKGVGNQQDGLWPTSV
ncbi:hypothetical protein DCC81_25100 [Chitinophaga parva]|uniref:Uncharacterized protein n=2 Tax=Chitinophaga parva TaxID=2169414 RepID=A0A2T7BBU7_9BACT|nr:hypothetical protein DCC81_25100 [Chitinophaga parva]